MSSNLETRSDTSYGEQRVPRHNRIDQENEFDLLFQRNDNFGELFFIVVQSSRVYFKVEIKLSDDLLTESYTSISKGQALDLMNLIGYETNNGCVEISISDDIFEDNSPSCKNMTEFMTADDSKPIEGSKDVTKGDNHVENDLNVTTSSFGNNKIDSLMPDDMKVEENVSDSDTIVDSSDTDNKVSKFSKVLENIEPPSSLSNSCSESVDSYNRSVKSSGKQRPNKRKVCDSPSILENHKDDIKHESCDRSKEENSLPRNGSLVEENSNSTCIRNKVTGLIVAGSIEHVPPTSKKPRKNAKAVSMFECPYCGYKNRCKHTMTKHIKRQHGPKALKCPYEGCDFAAHFPSRMQGHICKIHTGDLPFVCTWAGCEFKTHIDAHLQSHRRRHEVPAKDRHFKCEKCEFRALNMCEVRQHAKIHSDNRPHQCPQCPYRAKLASQLRSHLDTTHSLVNKYKCHLCDFTTNRRSTLNNHINITHTGVQTYSCPDCDFTTGYKNSIKKHSRRHTGTKPYVCHICGYASIHEYVLKQHLEIHDGVKQFVCDICGYSAVLRGYLTNHMLNMHGVERVKDKCLFYDKKSKSSSHPEMKTC